MSEKSCINCAHSYCEPDDGWVCGHADTNSTFGQYVHRASAEGAHCGPSLTKFEPHPKRMGKNAFANFVSAEQVTKKPATRFDNLGED